MSAFNTDFFDVNIKILKWSGIWVPDKNTTYINKIGFAIFNSFFITYTLLIFLPCEFIIIKDTAANLDDLMKNLSVAITHFLAAVKVVVWFLNRQEILNIINTLRGNALAYEATDDFNPENIIKEDKKLKDFWSKLFLFIGCVVAASACLTAALILVTDYDQQYIFITDVMNQTRVIYNQKLPYYSSIPFDFRSSRLGFGFAIVFQLFATLNFAFIVIGFDTLYAAIISYTSCQIKIIQGAFRTIRTRCLKRLNLSNKPVLHDSDEVNAELTKELNKGIVALQVIFEMIAKMESVFTYCILVQVSISMMVLCSCLFLTSSYPVTSEKFIVEFVYFIAISMQLAFYCYFGNKVTLRGEDIPLSLYEGDWFSASESFKRSMMITMTRMRRPIYLTIGKFTPLTLTTFVTISRAAYSAFAVLKNRNQNTLD